MLSDIVDFIGVGIMVLGGVCALSSGSVASANASLIMMGVGFIVRLTATRRPK